MGRSAARDVTQLLRRWQQGDQAAAEELLPLIYGELRKIARRHLRGERDGHTLEATALVHEVYLRLSGGAELHWNDRVHFYAVAAQMMRRVLVDHARSRDALKRGGSVVKISLDEARDPAVESGPDVVALDDALRSLEALDPRKSRIVELRFFGGLTLEETAAVLGISVPTVVKETRLARAWLHSQIVAGIPGQPGVQGHPGAAEP
ncbi:MAG TPA: sigma-70 family RNA polymerase sigma factor [Thermoanaerobaculia bacterium]|jgi:RNA polymerase sigma factor (TIGR02999 family)|nr:sigma-70 family RNA polymerase sigma factor [Thermoanaerobaculia bacterium]